MKYPLKHPPFLIAYSRVGNDNYIIHTRMPAFIARVFVYDSVNVHNLNEFEHQCRLEYKGYTAIIVIVSVLNPEKIEVLPGALKRLSRWYYGLFKEYCDNLENRL